MHAYRQTDGQTDRYKIKQKLSIKEGRKCRNHSDKQTKTPHRNLIHKSFLLATRDFFYVRHHRDVIVHTTTFVVICGALPETKCVQQETDPTLTHGCHANRWPLSWPVNAPRQGRGNWDGIQNVTVIKNGTLSYESQFKLGLIRDVGRCRQPNAGPSR